MSDTIRIRIFGAGRAGSIAELPARETGKLTVVARTDDTLVLKESGHRYWQGLRMERGYAPARFRVFRIESQGDWAEVQATEIVQFPAR
jgi:hypothetical protein